MTLTELCYNATTLGRYVIGYWEDGLNLAWSRGSTIAWDCHCAMMTFMALMALLDLDRSDTNTVSPILNGKYTLRAFNKRSY